MIKRIIKGLMVIGLLWVFMVSQAWGTEYGYIHYKVIPKSPSHLKPNKPISKLLLIGCYDAWSGQYLNCEFTHKVIGLKEPKEDIENNGGHCYDYDGHPLIDPPVCESESCDPPCGELEFAGSDEDDTPLGVKGQTQYQRAVIRHRMPQVAGRIVTETTITAPSGWRCLCCCFTNNSSKYQDTLDVEVSKLKELPGPASGEHYIKCRGEACPEPLPGEPLPEGHWGTKDTINKLKEIAEEYYDLTDRILSINDISLPRGGLFDYKKTWKPPHDSHRTGTDADINQGQGPENVDKIPCYKNKILKEAIKKIAGEQPYPILRCENRKKEYCLPPEGEDCIYYHIDFD